MKPIINLQGRRGVLGAAHKPSVAGRLAAHATQMRTGKPFSGGLRLGLGARCSQRAFTMVEIAICLGVIGFALVAIIGILPTGLNSQRDNRYDTIINHDGTYWMEAIRTGATGLVDLINYVERITNSVGTVNERIYTNPNIPPSPNNPPSPLTFTTGREIIGLLTPVPGEINTAVVYAISGAAVEKEPAGRDLGFKYRMNVTAVNYTSFSPEVEDPSKVLYDLRVSFRYAIRGSVTGKGRAAYRTLVSGTMTNYGNLYFYKQ